jgi:inosine/xanthosine triphosphatase
MKVAIGSKNPVKIEAVRLGFEKVLPDEAFEFIGVDTPSGVADQPMSDEEAIEGARNRARGALEASDADFGVGVEGSLHKIGMRHFQCGWIAVLDREGRQGIGSSCRMPFPERMIQMVKSGMEVGMAVDQIFGRTNAKHAEGYFGIITKGAITRTDGYRDGVIAALAPFLHKDLF